MSEKVTTREAIASKNKTSRKQTSKQTSKVTEPLLELLVAAKNETMSDSGAI